MMADYIKREDALKELLGYVPTDAHEIKDLDVIRVMLALPSADVAPVVRCKDCKWRNWETNGCDRNPCVEPWFENDFCSYGERKDNE